MRLFDWPPVWTALFTLVAVAMGLVWSPLGDGAVVGGIAVVAAALALMGWAAVTMTRARTAILPRKTPDALVTGGPFAFSRNPIYLADLCFVAGLALVMGQPLGLLLVWPLARTLERRFIAGEEARLAQAFGAAYEAYRARVRRWI